jgi:hypothetical protein
MPSRWWWPTSANRIRPWWPKKPEQPDAKGSRGPAQRRRGRGTRPVFRQGLPVFRQGLIERYGYATVSSPQWSFRTIPNPPSSPGSGLCAIHGCRE